MQTTSSSPHAISTLSSYFDLSQNGFAWREPRPELIMDRRAALDDKLIFDVLMVAGGIRDPDFLYPPRDVQGLERLLGAIESSTYDSLKKNTLVYYLLKWHQDGRENNFKVQTAIPPQFSALADAYWNLDSGTNIPKAVSILSDSRVNKDNCSKIIHAITLSPQPGPLVIKYVRTAKPQLVNPQDMLRYTVALSESSVLAAWQYQRTFSEANDMRPRLFRQIIDWAISPTIQPNALKSLISLPLSNFEQDLLNNHALKPPAGYSAEATSILQDLVCVRYVEHGKYIDAIKMDRKFSAAGFDKQDSSDRKAMIRDLYDSLSPVEKTLVEADITPVRTERIRAPQTPAALGGTQSTLTQSWEEIPVPESLSVSKAVNTPLRNIQIPSTPSSASIPQPNFNPAPTPPTASSSAVPAPPPLIPMSNTPSISANGFAARKNGQLSALGKGRPSLSGVGQRMSLSAGPKISSPASGLRFPVGPGKPSSSISAGPVKFVSTANQANAFFKPKPVPQKRPLPVEEEQPEEAPEADKNDMEVDNGPDQVEETQKEPDHALPSWTDDGAATELTRSIFGNDTNASAISAYPPSSSVKRTRGIENEETPAKKRQPPGAFATDEEAHGDDEDDAHEAGTTYEPAPEPAPQPKSSGTRRKAIQPTRTSSRVSAAPASPVKPTRKARQIKQKDFGRSIPGALMDEEDDHDRQEHAEEEEGDKLAPLRAPTPPPLPTAKRAKATALKRAQSVVSAASEAGSDVEGGPSTRRRSSRLTGSASMSNAAPNDPPLKARKGGRASTSKRKK